MSDDKKALFDAICGAIKAATREFLNGLRRDWPGEHMYSLVLEMPCEGTHVFAAAATEEGLERVVREYAEKGFSAPGLDTHAELKKRLRWGSPEDGWYSNFQAKFFAAADSLIALAHDQGHMSLYDKQLEELCLRCLRELDSEGLFGVGMVRDEVVIGICYVGGSNGDDEWIRWAEQVNPPHLVQRLSDGLNERSQAYETVSGPKVFGADWANARIEEFLKLENGEGSN